MTEPNITISVKVLTTAGGESEHRYPIHDLREGLETVKNVLAAIQEGIVRHSTVLCLENTTTIYNPGHVVKVVLDLLVESAESDNVQPELKEEMRKQIGSLQYRTST